jgi:hypothetical protein
VYFGCFGLLMQHRNWLCISKPNKEKMKKNQLVVNKSLISKAEILALRADQGYIKVVGRRTFFARRAGMLKFSAY